jgi:hypothetical protein
MLTEHAVSSLGLETHMKENKCDMNNKCKCLIQQSWKYKYDEHYTAGLSCSMRVSTYVELMALVADCLTLGTLTAFVDFWRLPHSSQNCYIEIILCSGQPIENIINVINYDTHSVLMKVSINVNKLFGTISK